MSETLRDSQQQPNNGTGRTRSADRRTADPVVVCTKGLDLCDRHTLRVVEVDMPLLDSILAGRREEVLAADDQGGHRVCMRLYCLSALERSVPDFDGMVTRSREVPARATTTAASVSVQLQPEAERRQHMVRWQGDSKARAVCAHMHGSVSPGLQAAATANTVLLCPRSVSTHLRCLMSQYFTVASAEPLKSLSPTTERKHTSALCSVSVATQREL